jgi:AcrR family transcriptional regulator
MSGTRRYQSPLREAQAALTRDRILMAAREYLEHQDIEALTLRRIADLSGVSAPTVYAHFPTMDHLVAAFFHWLKPRLGLLHPIPGLDELHTMPRLLFPRYEEHGALLRNLMNKPAWDRQRVNDRGQRHGAWLEVIAGELPQLTAAQLRRGGLAIAGAWTPTHWRWLMDTCGFTPEEAQTVASWTIRSLVEALKNSPSGLDLEPVPPPAASPENLS